MNRGSWIAAACDRRPRPNHDSPRRSAGVRVAGLVVMERRTPDVRRSAPSLAEAAFDGSLD
jgi:hypothetical protein